MTAIDREKLLAYIESEKAKNVKKHNDSDDDYDRDILIAKYIILEQISGKIKSGAFDIKSHEGRTGQAIRVSGEIEREDETHD